MIYPYLQYRNIVWASTYGSSLRPLVILQKRITKIIIKSDVKSHTTPIFKNLRLLKFHDINKLQVCQFMFRFKTHSVTPEEHSTPDRVTYSTFLLRESKLANLFSVIGDLSYLIHSARKLKIVIPIPYSHIN